MAAYLRNSDAFVWSIGADAGLRSTIVTLILLDRSPGIEIVAERFRWLSLQANMFRSRVVPSPWPAPPRWEPDTDFDLNFHVRKVGAPSPGNLDAVLGLARLAAMADFDSARPLWEATLIEGMADGGAALMCRMNHALTDGVGAVEIGRLLFDDPRRPRKALAQEAPGPPAAPWLDAVGDLMSAPARLTARAVGGSLRLAPGLLVGLTTRPFRTAGAVGSTMVSIWRAARPLHRGSPLMLHRSSVRELVAHAVSKGALHQAGKAAGGSLNDAFLGAVAGGIARYHSEQGVAVGDVVISMPINLRTATDRVGGNRTMLMRFDLPANVTDPMQRIKQIHERTAAQRSEKSLPYTAFIAGAFNIAPSWYVRSQLRNVDVLASNVPGFAAPVSLGDAAVQMQYAFSPTLGAAINVMLLSYCDVCALGINIDTAAIPDVVAFRECMVAGFDEVLALAG